MPHHNDRPTRRRDLAPAGAGRRTTGLRETLHKEATRLQQLLGQIRSQYLSLFDLAPIGYIILGDSGRIKALNLTFASMLGQLRAYMEDLPLILWVVPEDRALFLKHLRAIRRSRGEAVTCEVSLLGSKTSVIPAHLVSRRLPMERGMVSSFTAVIDISERHRTISALRKSESQLRATASNLEERRQEAESATSQLRSLAREMNKAELKERRRVARLLHDELQQLLVSAKIRLRTWHDAQDPKLNEVAKLLDQAITSSRTLTAQLSPPVLQDASLEGAMKWLARWMNDKHDFLVEMEVPPGLTAELDERAFLFEAAREALFNVVKHAGVSGARVSVRRGKDELQMEVSDQGRGFDPSRLDQEGPGEHLGLLSLRERVRLLGGLFDLRSAPGAGTTIRLSLPVEVKTVGTPEKASSPSRRRRRARVSPPSSLVRVIIVDDHRLVREGLQSFLSEEPWVEVVGEAADGGEAVALTRKVQPDVVIMDVTLPGMSGIEATREITAANPRVRVIGMSMHEHEDMAAAMLSAGAKRYLTKGGPPEDLIVALRSVAPEVAGQTPSA
ncbi:MAG: response regulator [Candidatus Polarisedimenticolia bacterium]